MEKTTTGHELICINLVGSCSNTGLDSNPDGRVLKIFLNDNYFITINIMVYEIMIS